MFTWGAHVNNCTIIVAFVFTVGLYRQQENGKSGFNEDNRRREMRETRRCTVCVCVYESKIKTENERQRKAKIKETSFEW